MIGLLALYLFVGFMVTVIACQFEGLSDGLPLFLFFLCWPFVAVGAVVLALEFLLRGVIRGQWELP